jgi:nitrogen fixation protein NifU and related proteins
MNGMDELYREVILDHYKSPRGRGTCAEATVTAEGKNPLCGDELTLFLTLDGTGIAAVQWEGIGCSLCMASSSMLAEQLPGKSFADAAALLQSVIGLMHNKQPAVDDLGDLEVLEGVKRFPVRIKCVLLPWTTLQEGLRRYAEGEERHVEFSY